MELAFFLFVAGVIALTVLIAAWQFRRANETLRQWKQQSFVWSDTKTVDTSANIDLLPIANRRVLERSETVQSLVAELPPWFLNLGTDSGFLQFQQQYNPVVTKWLRAWYANPGVGCWLMANSDTDITYQQYASDPRHVSDPMPPVVRWYCRNHVVIGELQSSQVILAVDLDSETPRVEWGYMGAKCPFKETAGMPFSEWLSGIARSILDAYPEEPRQEEI